MQGIFRRLEKEAVSVRNSLENKCDEDAELLEMKKELLDEIVEYVDSYEWLYKSPLKEKVKFFIQSGYDYESLCNEFAYFI